MTIVITAVIASVACIANAEATCVEWDPSDPTVCVVWASDTTTPGGSDGTGTGTGGRPDPKPAPRVCKDSKYSSPAKTIPCSTAAGIWDDLYQCYAKRATLPDGVPPPADGDPILYHCMPPPYAPASGAIDFWRDSMGRPAPPDPAVLARQVFATMSLYPIDIGLAPSPGRTSLVNLPVWMWAQNPRPATWGPYEKSASDRGLTVTVVAEVDRVVWDMGDGNHVTCQLGTARPTSAPGTTESPDCGHVYRKASKSMSTGAYRIVATSYWSVRWTAGAESGVISAVPTTTQPVSLTIEESRPVLVAP